MILGHGRARLDALVGGADTVDAGAEPVTGRGPLLRVVADQRCGQRSVAVASRDGLEQISVAVPGRYHTHRDRHAAQVRGGNLVCMRCAPAGVR